MVQNLGGGGINLPSQPDPSYDPVSITLSKFKNGTAIDGLLYVLWISIFVISLGAGLSYETAKYLKNTYGIEPVHMLISGATAPQVDYVRLFITWYW